MKQLLILLLFMVPLTAKEATVKQLFNVQTVKVKEAKAAFSLKNYGYVTADESRIYDVAPRFGGYITRLYGDKIYQKVAKGERLAKVYSPDVLQSKEDYVNALSYNQKRPSPEMVKSAREKLALLGLQEAEIDALKKRGRASEESYIYAPSDGYLFSKNINNLGAFNAKQKLFTIVDLSKVWIEVKIYQKDLYRYRELNNFSVKVVGLEKAFKATKLQLYPNIDPKAATATLRLEALNRTGELLPGMYATITASGSAESRLTLPSTAVIRKNGRYYVFGVSEYEGEYEPIAVDAELLDNNTYIIKGGLNKGDEVVDNALFMMDSDAQINGLY
jgi:Cu(I)/Ag(I) efflux system membrane fusion protein